MSVKKQLHFKTSRQYAKHIAKNLLEAFEIGNYIKETDSIKTKYKPVSLDQMTNYVLDRPGFNTFFGDWERSNFKSHLRPKLNFDLPKLLKDEPQDLATRMTTVLLENEEAMFVDDIAFMGNKLG